MPRGCKRSGCEGEWIRCCGVLFRRNRCAIVGVTHSARINGVGLVEEKVTLYAAMKVKSKEVAGEVALEAVLLDALALEAMVLHRLVFSSPK